VSLPVVSDSPCFGCTTRCCFEYVVPVNGHDLWRLMRTLSLPWSELVTVRNTPGDWAESFTLDGGTDRYAFLLRKQPDGGCAMLLSLGSGQYRCGTHAARPLACRIYPFNPAWRAPTGIDFASHALCPPTQRARFDAKKGSFADEVLDQLGARALYVSVVARWDEAARQRPREQPYGIDDFVRWALSLYDEIAPLRASGEPRPSWQRRAEAYVAVFPLPADYTAGC
jgi:hypothetical protein